ncbi:acetyl-CoA carboxylase biotin carboxyl carrier protein subunit [Pseudomonas mandelii]|jgi:acetyl-CoA carboxylase biotin carboxyl carrier protein|uniref:Biotin/lipoyl-binding protein n=1 Tax=Pseudomonas mandelii TaxID=75612 RepID=A0A502IFA1_9PSED|nr:MULTISPECIES: acetyl-CoA carboxylase biotin carboxyl carrier protein subunit [Pseudomonas]TPG84088.1 biotin/lipoyl-binding protein [Pseudomonas mandelii]TPG93145.1 biotin/lipoyl-binding protein [Pseudomonas caspiana]
MSTIAVKSDVAGTVWQIHVCEGDVVEEDQMLIIMESMKMEIPLMALESGRVVSVLVAEGDVVKDGQDVLLMECD